jgi:hypothetical protein
MERVLFIDLVEKGPALGGKRVALPAAGGTALRLVAADALKMQGPFQQGDIDMVADHCPAFRLKRCCPLSEVAGRTGNISRAGGVLVTARTGGLCRTITGTVVVTDIAAIHLQVHGVVEKDRLIEFLSGGKCHQIRRLSGHTTGGGKGENDKRQEEAWRAKVSARVFHLLISS